MSKLTSRLMYVGALMASSTEVIHLGVIYREWCIIVHVVQLHSMRFQEIRRERRLLVRTGNIFASRRAGAYIERSHREN